MNYTIIRNPRSKRVKIKVSANGEITIVAPHRISKKECDRFFLLHENWLAKILEKIKLKHTELLQYKLDMNGKTLYLGNTMQLEIDPNIKQKYIISDKVLILKSENIEHFYRSEARKIFETKCAEIAPFYGVGYKKIRIGAPKSRWGSYSSSGTLSFNYNLIKAPHSVIEYVVIHELCHILHPNHSSRFWLEVGRLCSDYQQKRRWLRENQVYLSS